MAVNVDSPKRTSLRLLEGKKAAENECAAAGTRTPASVTAAPRTSGPVTRLSAGKKRQEEKGSLDSSQKKATGEKHLRNRSWGNTSHDRSDGQHMGPPTAKKSKRGAAYPSAQREERLDTLDEGSRPRRSNRRSGEEKQMGSVEVDKPASTRAQESRVSDHVEDGLSIEGDGEGLSTKAGVRQPKTGVRSENTYDIGLRSRKSCANQEVNEQKTPRGPTIPSKRNGSVHKEIEVDSRQTTGKHKPSLEDTTAKIKEPEERSHSPDKNKRPRRSCEGLKANNDLNASRGASEGIVASDVNSQVENTATKEISNPSPLGVRGAAHTAMGGKGHGDYCSPDKNLSLKQSSEKQEDCGLKTPRKASEDTISVGGVTNKVGSKPSPKGKQRLEDATTMEEGSGDPGRSIDSPNIKVSSITQSEKNHIECSSTTESGGVVSGEDGSPSLKTDEKAGPSTESKERCHDVVETMMTENRDCEEAAHFVEPNTQSNLISGGKSSRKTSRPVSELKGSGEDGKLCHNEPYLAQSVNSEAICNPEDLREAGPSSSCHNDLHVSDKAGPSRLSGGNSYQESVATEPGYSIKGNQAETSLPSKSTAMEDVPPRDYKVQCCSKQLLQEVLNMCTGICEDLLNSQQYLNEEQKQQHQKNFGWDFETAFQENVSINGLSWHEAPDKDTEPDIKILEDQLDDIMVETAQKRKRYPKKILGHYVKKLKTEREVLSLYKPVVNPEKFALDSAVEQRMKDLSATTATICQQIHETKKALPVQLKKAEGFSQVLALQPILEGSQIRKDIFSCRVMMEDILKRTPRVLETTPAESASQQTSTLVLSLRRRKVLPADRHLYPLRSKRKIRLET